MPIVSRLIIVMFLLFASLFASHDSTAIAGCNAPNGNRRAGFRAESAYIRAVKTQLVYRYPMLGCTTHPESFTLESVLLTNAARTAWIQLGWARSADPVAMNTLDPITGQVITNTTRFWVQVQPYVGVNTDEYFSKMNADETVSIEREWLLNQNTLMYEWYWISKIGSTRVKTLTHYSLFGNTTGNDMVSAQFFGETSFNNNQMGGGKNTPGQYNLLSWKRNSDSNWNYIKNGDSSYFTATIFDPSPVYKYENFKYADDTWRVRNWTVYRSFIPIARR